MIERLATAPDAALLAEVVELEAELSRLQYRQLSVLAELNCRNVPATLGFRGLADLISVQVRCTRMEARKRALAVERFGARRSLTGESLEPVLPQTAAVLATGEINAEHGAAIAETVEAIPAVSRPSTPHRWRPRCWSTPALTIRVPSGCWVSGSWLIWIRTVRARTSSGCGRRTGS